MKIVNLVNIKINAKRFVNKKFLKKNKISIMFIKKAICFQFINNIKVFNITRIINLKMLLKNY